MKNTARSTVRALSVTAAVVGCVLTVALVGRADGPAATGPVMPLVTLFAPGVQDQDDMCFWRHPTDPGKSLVICSDKYASRLFVYDLEGTCIQSLPAPKPGNIDSRPGFPLGGKKVDIVVHNQRVGGFKLLVHAVDPDTRKLTRVDDGTGIPTGVNYGGCLYKSRKTGKFYFFTTSKKVKVTQFELSDNGKGQVVGKEVRGWKLGFCEGAVADDANGRLFVAKEDVGVFAFDAEPDAPTTGKLIARCGDASGLRADAEGVTIYPTSETEGYLIVSSQGNNSYKFYDRLPPHTYIGTVVCQSGRETDGIDAIAGNFGPQFPQGIFAFHTGADQRRCPVKLCSWKDVVDRLPKPGKAE